MSGSHDKLPWLFWVQLILVAIVGTLFIYYAVTGEKHGEAEAHASANVKAAAGNLKPVGAVAIKSDTAAGSSKARSGEKVFNDACAACHTTGIANAPKPDDKAAWEPRIAQGLDGLLKTAIDGKGAMPPRGGNPAVTDAELKASIIYMTKKAGFDLASGTPAEKEVDASASPSTEAPEKIAAAPTEVKLTITPAEPVSIEAPKPVEAPAAPAPPAAPAAALATTTPATMATAATAKQASNAEGEKTYKSTCFSCHAAGVAGAPKLDDKAAWAPRLASGNEALYTSALKGKGIMPPKGGNMGISDAAIKLAVDYMVSQAQ